MLTRGIELKIAVEEQIRRFREFPVHSSSVLARRIVEEANRGEGCLELSCIDRAFKVGSVH